MKFLKDTPELLHTFYDVCVSLLNRTVRIHANSDAFYGVLVQCNGLVLILQTPNSIVYFRLENIDAIEDISPEL